MTDNDGVVDLAADVDCPRLQSRIIQLRFADDDTMFPGFPDSGRDCWHWPDDTDAWPAQNVNIRTNLHRTDVQSRDQTPILRKGCGVKSRPGHSELKSCGSTFMSPQVARSQMCRSQAVLTWRVARCSERRIGRRRSVATSMRKTSCPRSRDQSRSTATQGHDLVERISINQSTPVPP